MTYAMISSYGKTNRSISAACAVLRGFHQKYPLTLDERKHLRLLIACRLALSATMGNFSYKQNPQNEYLLLHAKPAWDALDFIWGSDNKTTAAIEHAFYLACDGVSSESSDESDCTNIAFPDPSVADPFSSVREVTGNKSVRTNGSKESVVTFVTGNKKKAEEVQRILSGGKALPFTLVNHKVDLPELQGDALDVAKEKCALAAKEINGAVIVEDTSLSFNALNGMPGVYIKWFLESNGLDGLNDMISFSDDKSGYAQTVVAFSEGPEKEVLTFVGRTHGKIVRPRGSLDFGWDPIFEPDEGNGLTYAEMAGEQKDSISHRKRAFIKLREYIDKKKG